MLPAGRYKVVAAGEGFGKTTLEGLVIDQDTRKDFYISRDGFTLPEVVVSTSRASKTQASHEEISKDELTSVPGTGGDVLRALQSLPGVAVANDFSGELIVRGGGPQDNLYLLDRIPIAFPFHFGGLLSTIDSDLIQNVDFSAGGFGPEYGNFWGGVIDVTQREPRKDRWGGRAEVNLLLSEGEIEGPLSSNTSLSISGRRSYLELFGSSFGDNFTAIPSFGDYEVKLSYDYSPKTHWDFEAFGSDDLLGINIKANSGAARNDPSVVGLFQFHNGYDSQGINYRRTADDQNTLLNTLYHYVFFFDTTLGQNYYLNIRYEDIGDWFTWKHDFDKDSQLEAGLQFDHALTGDNSYFANLPGEGDPDLNFTNSKKIMSDVTTSASNMGAYADEKWKWFDEKLSLSLGLRGDFLAYNSHFSWGPRFSAAYFLGTRTTLKASYGYYYQLPIQGPYLDPNFGNPNLFSEKAVSTILGIEQNLGDGLYLRLEGYNKDLSDVVVENSTTNFSNAGTGYTRGAEIFLRRAADERFFGWISYSLSESIRHNFPGDTHLYDYDQPNILTVVASYKLNPGWDIGLKFHYSSGLPNTPTVPPYYYSEPVTVNGVPQTINLPNYGPVNSARYPDYQRLDLSTSLATVYDTWQWRFYIEAINVLNTKNIFAYDYNATYTPPYKSFNEFPFLPYVGLEVKY